MGVALHLYSDDNHDSMAYCGWDNGQLGGGPGSGGERPNNPGWLYQCTATGIPSPFNAAYTNSPQEAWTSGAWFNYVHNYASYLCPVDIQSKTYTKHLRQNELSSYVMNGAVVYFQDPGSPDAYAPPWKMTRISDIWSPECYVLWEPDENELGPGNPGAEEFNDSSNYPEAPGGYEDLPGATDDQGEGIGPLHGKNGGNILAIDGHVDYISTNAFRRLSNYYGSGPGGKGFLWWSPFTKAGD
jgi:prepilin-type processing-associated H-X9-DG protein